MLLVVSTMMAQESETTERKVKWTAPASYYSQALDQTFDTKVAAYSDGTYEVQGIYGSTDKNIVFTINHESVVEDIPEIILTNYYSAQAPYYYFAAGDYTICVYYERGAGYTGWEGEADEPCLWFYSYVYDSQNNYMAGGFDTVSWNAADVTTTGITAISPIANEASQRITSLTGITYDNRSKLPHGIYVSDRKICIRN